MLSSVTPRPAAPPLSSGTPPPSPVYPTWSQFLAEVPVSSLRKWCSAKANKANDPRLMSGTPEAKITGRDPWAILSAAQGRCSHCGSLAIERRPSTANGGPASWGDVGRRIGSLGHVVSRSHGGPNTPENLGWSCLWCNTWPEERRMGATDHGGHHPPAAPDASAPDPFAGIPVRPPTKAHRRCCSSCDELVDTAELDGWPGNGTCDNCADVDEDLIWEEPGYGCSAHGPVVAL